MHGFYELLKRRSQRIRSCGHPPIGLNRRVEALEAPLRFEALLFNNTDGASPTCSSRVQGASSSGRVQGRAAAAAAAVQDKGGRAGIQERARARLQARMHAEGRGDASPPPPSSSRQRSRGRNNTRGREGDGGIRGARAVAARAAVTAKGGRAEVQRRARQRLDSTGACVTLRYSKPRRNHVPCLLLSEENSPETGRDGE